MYADDYDGWFVSPFTQIENNATAYWIRALTRYGYVGNTVVPATGGPYRIELRLGRCPSAKHYTWSSATLYALKTLAGDNVPHHLKRVKNTSVYSLILDSISQSQTDGYYDRQVYRINWAAKQYVHFRHLGLTNVAFADGSVRAFNKDGLIDSERLNSAFNGVVSYTSTQYFWPQ